MLGVTYEMVGVRWAEVRPSTLNTTSTASCCILAAVWIEDMGYRYTLLLLSVSLSLSEISADN